MPQQTRHIVHIRVIPKVSPPISNAFAPYPLFQWYPQSKEILLNLGMKCWTSAFNAQRFRVITVVVQVGAVKIYVATVQALRKKETQDETQFTTKIGVKSSLGPSYFLFIPSYAFDGLSCRNWPFSPSKSPHFTDNSRIHCNGWNHKALSLTHVSWVFCVRKTTFSCSELDLIQELEMSNRFEPSQIHDLIWVKHGSGS